MQNDSCNTQVLLLPVRVIHKCILCPLPYLIVVTSVKIVRFSLKA